MRGLTVIALAVTMTMLLSSWCQAGSLRASNLAEDEEEFHHMVPHPRHYRDYGFIQRVIRDDDLFDDYGHMRFGRSDN